MAPRPPAATDESLPPDDRIIAEIRASLSERLHAEIDLILSDLVTDVVLALLEHAPEISPTEQ